MAFPPLVYYQTESEYQLHFEKIYCRTPVITFDEIAVRFKKQDFNHAFFETVVKKDDTFSSKRAERIDWIKAALKDPTSERYVGWDNKKKKYDYDRRIALIMTNYVVVISIFKIDKARFVTAFVADSARSLHLIRQNPKWTKKNR